MGSNLTATFICKAVLLHTMERGGGVIMALTRSTDDDYDKVNQRMGLPDDIAEGVVSMAFQATETMTSLLVPAAEYERRTRHRAAAGLQSARLIAFMPGGKSEARPGWEPGRSLATLCITPTRFAGGSGGSVW